MKRYWKLILITIVVVLTIGTFYIQSAVVGNNYPKFVFDKKGGDEEVVNGLILMGDYREGMGIQGSNLQISSEGTVYHSELSYFEGLGGIYTDPQVKKLQEEHRNFMRGKSIWEIDEDESLVVYANVDPNQHSINKDSKFAVEILEKTSNDKTSFTIDLPGKEKYRHVYVEDVKVVDEEIKVVTSNYLNDINDEAKDTEMHVYRFDMSEQKIVSDEIIFSFSERNENTWSSMHMLGEGNNSDASNYIVFKLEQWEDMQGNEGSYYSEEIGSEIITFNIKTNEQIELELPEELHQFTHTATVDGSMIYFNKETEKGFEVISYNIDSQEIENTPLVKIPKRDNDKGMGSPLITVKDGIMYISSPFKEHDLQADILVVDLNSGEMLYEGMIEIENVNSAQQDYYLYIHDIVIE